MGRLEQDAVPNFSLGIAPPKGRKLNGAALLVWGKSIFSSGFLGAIKQIANILNKTHIYIYYNFVITPHNNKLISEYVVKKTLIHPIA